MCKIISKKRIFILVTFTFGIVLIAFLSLYFTTLLSTQTATTPFEEVRIVDNINWKWGFPFTYIKDNPYGSSLGYIGFFDDIIDYKLGVFNLFIFILLYCTLFKYIQHRFKRLGKFNFIRPKNIFFILMLFFLFIDFFLLYGPAILYGSLGPRPFTIQEKIHDLIYLILISGFFLFIMNFLYFFVFNMIIKKKMK